MATHSNDEKLIEHGKDNVIVDDEKPCCSKSIQKENQKIAVVPVGETTENREITNNFPTSHYLPEQSNFGLAFSDTVLTIIPKLPGLDEQPEQGIDNTEDYLEPWNDEDNDDETQLKSAQIARKPPKVSLVAKDSSKASCESNDAFDMKNLLNANVDSREQFLFDENNNEIKWPAHCEKKLLESASYLFHEDRRHHLAKTLNLLPRGREYAVFNVFTDFARLFGYGKKKRRNKHVMFPSEVMQQYEQKGDVAGKDRFVPTAKTPYKGIAASTKKRKLSAVYSSWTVKEADFVPRVERIDDYSKFEHCCERKCIACDCLTNSTKPDLTNVMEGYLSDLNVAGLFIHGHSSRTFESAMNNLEFARSSLKTSISNLNQVQVLQRGYAKHKLGILSGSVWIFGYCIRSILQQAIDTSRDNSTSLPNETYFRNLLEQFAAMCLSMMDSIKIVLQYSHNFYNFCKECIRILKILQIHVGFREDLKMKRPLKRGDGLALNRKLRKKDLAELKAVSVMIARTKPSVDEDDEVLEWKSFEELNGYDKVACLRHLLNTTTEGINLVQTQLRFLVDDIVDSVRDITEADLLFILADMHDRVRFLENVGTKHIKAEMEQICRLMTDFCKDIQAFIDLGQHIMKRFVEVSDMIHVTYEFLTRGLHLECLSEMLPANAFKKQLTLFGFCGHGVRSRKRIVEKHQPKYQPIDFFRVYFDDAVNQNAEIHGIKLHFNLIWSKNKIGPIFPTSAKYNWGEIEGSPHMSFEEYAEPETDEEVQTDLLKPILLASPLASPRGSVISNDDGGGGGETSSGAPEASGNKS